MISTLENQQRSDLPAQLGGSSSNGAAGRRLTGWIVGVGIAQVLAIGAMIWAATQVVLRALPHL
jgi:hypothetical protein